MTIIFPKPDVGNLKRVNLMTRDVCSGPVIVHVQPLEGSEYPPGSGGELMTVWFENVG